jgi:O-antigen ligase
MHFVLHRNKLTPTSLTAILFAVALLVLPFNEFSSLSILGELSAEAAAYPMLLVVSLYTVRILSGKIEFPKHISFIFLLGFFGWTIISGVVNFQTIIENFTKGRTGYNKYVLQMILLVFLLVSALAVYRLVQRQWREQTLFTLRRWLLYSFLLAATYSLIEIPYILFGAEWASGLLERIDPFIRIEEPLYENRLRSVSGEASWFAMYMAFALPWLLSYIFTEKGKKKWFYVGLNIYAIFMIYLSYSRTAYVITAAEIMAFIGAVTVFGGLKFKRYLVLVLFGLVIATTLYMLSVEKPYERIEEIVVSLTTPGEETAYHMSNIGRFGSQNAAWRMSLEWPIFGAGLGQYGFHMPDYVAAKDFISGEIQKWASSSEDTPWAPAHGIFPRFAAETGFVGLGLWLLMWITLCWSIWQRCRLSLKRGIMIELTLLISIGGTLLVGFNTDTFRFFGYWFLLAIGWGYVSPNSPILVPRTVNSPDYSYQHQSRNRLLNYPIY